MNKYAYATAAVICGTVAYLIGSHETGETLIALSVLACFF